jgi:hypothetical protein
MPNTFHKTNLNASTENTQQLWKTNGTNQFFYQAFDPKSRNYQITNENNYLAMPIVL